jgi:hypothetical protein
MVLIVLGVFLDAIIMLAATMRLVRFFTLDDLGRNMLIPLETRLRARLSPARQWVADGFTCPFCIGMWIGLVTVVSYPGLEHGQFWLTAWRVVFGALALNYVVAHLVSRWDIYDGDDDQEAR